MLSEIFTTEILKKFRLFFLLLGLGVFTSMLYISIRYYLVFPPSEVHFTIKDIYNPVIAAQLNEWLHLQQTHHNLGSQDPYVIASQLSSTFPLVSGLSWKRYQPMSVECTVYGASPQFLINNNLVAATNGKIYERTDFQLYQTPVPSLFITEKFLDPSFFPLVYAFLKTLSATIFEEYFLSYKDPYSIMLFSRNTAKKNEYTYVCITDEQSIKRLPQRDVIQALCKDIVARDEKDKATTSYFYFDFRFEKQVVGKGLSKKAYDQLRKVIG